MPDEKVLKQAVDVRKAEIGYGKFRFSVLSLLIFGCFSVFVVTAGWVLVKWLDEPWWVKVLSLLVVSAPPGSLLQVVISKMNSTQAKQLNDVEQRIESIQKAIEAGEKPKP